MVLISLIYGFSFILLGIAIFVYPRKRSVFKLAKNLNLLAMFGIVHGIHDWMEMLRQLASPPSVMLGNIDIVILPISYFILFQFGTKSIQAVDGKYRLLNFLPLILVTVWFVTVASGRLDHSAGEVLARYLLGFPGALFASAALFSEISEIRGLDPHGSDKFLRRAAWAMLFYGIFSGLIVPKSVYLSSAIPNTENFLGFTGIPVEIFRTICACVIAYCMLRVLGIFDWEAQEKLTASEARFRTLADAAYEAVAITEGGIILDANRQLSDMLGYSLDKLRGTHVVDIVAPEDREIVRLGYEAAYENRLLHRDGSIVTVETRARHFTMDNRKIRVTVLRDITERKKIETEREMLINQLKEALANVKQLSGLLPICAACKKIRDDKGYWRQIESYIASHSEASFTHGYCPDCAEKAIKCIEEFREKDNGEKGEESK